MGESSDGLMDGQGNKKLVNSDHGGPRNWHIQYENNGCYAFTGSETNAFFGKAISHLGLLHMFLLFALCITLCWRFGCRF